MSALGDAKLRDMIYAVHAALLHPLLALQPIILPVVIAMIFCKSHSDV